MQKFGGRDFNIGRRDIRRGRKNTKLWRKVSKLNFDQYLGEIRERKK